MSENKIKTRICHAVKSESDWSTQNPVLKDGECGYVRETGRYKVGDGKTAWNSLAYAQPSSHTHDLDTMINALTIGTSTPKDADYYISQYAGGGTTTTSYHRKPMSSLFAYVKSKLAKVAESGSYNDLTNKPTIGNGTVTVTQNGTTKGTFSMNQTGNATVALADTNTWRGIQDNLTSTSASDSLSANQGRLLANGSARDNTKLPLTGGAITGRIVRSTSVTWAKSRENAVVFNTASSASAYKPVVGVKTPNGAWTIGSFQDESLLFSYTTDENYEAGTNSSTSVYLPAQAGTIITNATVGSAIAGGVKDSNNGNTIKITYNKAAQSSTSWLASWNGYELGAISPSKLSVGSAAKLATARTITLGGLSSGSATFDGSGNITIDNWGYGTKKYITNGSVEKPYFRIAYAARDTNYYDASMILVIDSGHSGGGFGIVKVAMRNNNISTANQSTCVVKWLVRQGFAASQIFVKGNAPAGGEQYADLYFKSAGTYDAITVTALSMGGRGSTAKSWTFDSGDPRAAADIRTYTYTVEGSDDGTALNATKATQDSAGQQINTTYIKALSVSGQTITYTKGNGSTGTISTQDTHFTTGIKVCASATGTANAAATNGNTRINILDNSTVRGSVLIKGTGATSVTSDANGVITINSTNTTYSTGTASKTGLTKLYTDVGTATDGTMTQKVLKENFDLYLPLTGGRIDGELSFERTNLVGLDNPPGISFKTTDKPTWRINTNTDGCLVFFAGSTERLMMDTSNTTIYRSLSVQPVAKSSSMMVQVSTAYGDDPGRTISLYASSDKDMAGLYDHTNGWILWCDTSSIVHITKTLALSNVVMSGKLQYTDGSNAYDVIRRATNSNYTNLACLGNTSYETSLYTSGKVWRNGSTTTYFNTTSTSDQRFKVKTSDMSAYEDFFCKLKPFAFKYHDGLYNAKTTKPLIQWGYGAQDTIQAFEECGLDWKQEEFVVEEDGELTAEEKKYATDGRMLKMNYQNMAALNTHMIQKCLEEIENLRAELNALKEGSHDH